MRHPLEQVPRERRERVLVVSIGLTLATMAALGAIDRSLHAEPTPIGVVSFELCAWNDRCADAIRAWEPVRLEAGMSIGLDYLFMPLYALAIGAALVFGAGRRGGERRRAIAAALAWAVLAAAGLDAIENAALFAMLATREASAALAWTATLCASVKLAAIAIALVALPWLSVGRRG